MCGLSGYIGNEPANIDKLKILGIYNVTRGTDSCGIVINDKVCKGVKEDANFTNFIEKKNLSTHEKHNNYNVLIHTRNASVKSTKDDIDCAHPFVIRNKKGKTVLIGVHNGFISNEDEIAKEYKVKEEKVDSQTILSILAKAKYDPKYFNVLKDYEGAAALAWYYVDEPNTMYLWKGASKKYAGTETLEEERPLFIYRVKDSKGKFTDNYYFSSIKESLYAIGGEPGFSKEHTDKEPTVFSLQANMLVTIKPGEKLKMRKIERTITNSSVYGYSNTNYSSYSSYKPSGKTDTTAREKLMKMFEGYPVTKWRNVSINTTAGKPIVDNEPYYFDQQKITDKIYFHRGRYWRNGHLVGKYETCVSLELDIDGYPKGNTSCDTESIDTYYFFHGFLLLSKESAKEIDELSQSGRIWENKEKGLINTGLLKEHVFGWCANFKDTTQRAQMKGSYWANGDFIPMFDYDRKFNFISGGLNSVKFGITPSERFETIKKFEGVINPKIISLPQVLQKVEVSSDLNEDIVNHAQDVMSSINSTLDKMKDVKDESKYKTLFNILGGFYNSVSKQVEILDKEENKQSFTKTKELGPLYS